MRDILFRGKTVGTNGKFVYGNLIYVEGYCCILERKEDLHPMDEPYLDGEIGWIDGKATPVHPETVGQFTGLHDKNGKMIFEGDICKTDLKWGSLLQIIFNNYCATFQVLFDDGYSEDFRQLYSDVRHIEVIGNIHDNPELMEAR